MTTLQLAIGWFALGVAGFLAIAVIVLIIRGRINLESLLGDKNNDASLSRFQFLVFTFVIGFSFLYLVFARENAGFPEISGGVLTLLGISGSSYLVAKGIDGPTPDDTPEDKERKAKERSAREQSR
jgi:hypothetical protein